MECDLALGQVAVLLEGSAAGVAARAAALRSTLGEAVVSETPPPWWGRYPFGDGDIGLKLAAPVSLVPAILTALYDHLGDAVVVRGSLGSGVLYAGLPSTVDASAVAAALDGVRARLAGTGGNCVVATAPAPLRDSLDLWGEVPGLPLMRRIKEQFDPAGRFAAGRFVGGL
jgi:glycolate oxidase FAD binding subunit